MKKIVSMILALCLIFPVFALFASAETAAPAVPGPGENEYPVIIVRGMDFLHGLHYDVGTENEREAALEVSFGGVVKTLYRAFGKLVTKFSKDAAVQEILDYVYEALGVYAMTPDGESLRPNVSAPYYEKAVSAYPELVLEDLEEIHEDGLVRSACERYGADRVYYFKYDWRLDTLENAARLDTMINTALGDHGVDKVDLVCCSMGGIVTLTYLNYYGSDKIDSLIANSSTMNGTDVTTELMQKHVVFEEDVAYRFLVSKLPQVKPLWTVMYKTKVIKLVVNFLNQFADDYRDEVFDTVLIPTFGSMPAIWEIVQHDQYEEAKSVIFGDKLDEYAGLLTKTDKIQNEVAANAQNILDEALSKGMKFGVIAGYNTPLTPVYPSARYQGDATLETSKMSFGALVSPVGEKLGEEELRIGDAKYVSPDGCINASTALYRDYTWFTKDSSHVGCTYNSDYTMLIFSILEHDTQPTVTTWEKFPQFLQADENENFTPVTAAKGLWD